MTRQLDIKVLFWIALALTFLTISFRERIGNVYIGLVVIDSLLLFFMVKRKIFLNSISGNTLKSIAIGFFGYAILFVVYYFSSFILQGFTDITAGQPLGQAFTQMISLMKTQSALVFETSKLLEIFAIGILIPIVETKVFFGSMFDFLSQSTKTQINNLKNARLWILMLVLSGLFTWFHVAVRGQSNVGWFITFAFGMISCIMVVKTREVESATYFHIINNLIIKLKGG